MHDRHGDVVRLMLPSGDVTFRFDLAAGENAVLPFGVMLGGVLLDWATAQPITHIGDTWFFMAPDGMKPVYCIAGQEYAVQPGEILTVDGLTIVTLTREESRGFSVINHRAYLCRQPLWWDGASIRVETEDGAADVMVYENGKWLQRTLGAKREPVNATFRQVGVGRYVVDVPQALLQGHKQVLLRVRYVGDIGHAFINGQMISDNFANGAEWDVRLDCYADELTRDPLTIYITPIKAHVTVDVSSAMAGRLEKAEGLKAELLRAEIVMVDEIRL